MTKQRTTETPLELPTFSRFMQLVGRGIRFRCPHCGKGPVLTKWGDVRERCNSCNFRYQRSDDNYFGGAVFAGIWLVEAIFGISLAAAIILTWPNVPWDMMTYVGAFGMLVLALVIQPIARMAWLTLDTLVRPIMVEECE